MDPLKIAIYHGYELAGSGSNEYTRYLSRTFAELGHDVVVICGEEDPASHPFVSRVLAYRLHSEGGAERQTAVPRTLFDRDVGLPGRVSLHQLPRTSVLPVYLTDQQRPGNVKTFPQLSDSELAEYHAAMAAVVRRVLADERPHVLHANHLVYQPVVAAEVCREAGVPFYVVPHGSSVEYTIRQDERFRDAARTALRAAAGVVWISREIRDRVLGLYPDLAPEIEAKSHAVGIGTDTSLFRPVPLNGRRRALERLAQLHRSGRRGGKTPAQRHALRRRLDGGDVEATRDFWDAYDHKLPDDDLPALLERLPVEQDLLLFVGSLTWGKGIHSLIAALPGILKRRPRTHLVVIGSGTFREVLEALVHGLASGNEPLFDEIVRRGRALERGGAAGALTDVQAYGEVAANRATLFEHGPQLAAHVHFLGRLDHPRLRSIFPCCRIGVFPSLIKEASPLVFAEALANGVLPAGSYHSGLRDGLDDLRPHVPAAIWRHMKLEVDPARRIQRLVDDLSALLAALEQEDLSPRLRRIAEERYDWKAVASSLATTVGMIRRRLSLGDDLL